ncbi:MAG: alpha/beta hydrolase, partial [Clostridia bacterium]|nr:alpha/beta hydrolase [Clostridia bacterium]
MKHIEYGKHCLDTIILLHGGGLSWWNYEEVAKSLQKDYHIILPILDGHAESDKTFTTIENNAKEIIEYIDAHCGGSVLMFGGLS